MTISRTFNGYGEVAATGWTSGGSSAFSFGVLRDNTGQITQKTETTAGGSTVYAYNYDDLGRLANVTRDGQQVEAYSYDANGNRTGEMNALRGIPSREATYSAEDHLLQAGDNTYQFDLDGFLAAKHTTEGTTTYDYSRLGELKAADLPDGRHVSYDYDPFGRRIAKRIDGSIVEKYLWAGQTTLLAVCDADGSLKSRFSYGDGRVPYSMETSSGTYYLAHDQVGSVRVVTDQDGHVFKEISYDSFGNVLSDSNPELQVPFGFAGGLYDEDTKLAHFGARDYDPAVGRFTAKDPIDFAGGDANLYGYCLDDPVDWVDPLGLVNYVDINGQLGHGLGVTFGTMIDEEGHPYPYVGPAWVTGPGASFTWGSNPTSGLNVAGQAACGVAGQWGYTFGRRWGPFWELGHGSPGVAGSVYWVFDWRGTGQWLRDFGQWVSGWAFEGGM